MCVYYYVVYGDGWRCCFVFFFKQKTAYEMRISDWSSDVCSSDLSSFLVFIFRFSRRFRFWATPLLLNRVPAGDRYDGLLSHTPMQKIGRESCRERVCQYV